MKRFILLFAFILSASTIQAQTTNIQATITDPHSIPYSFGTGSVSLVCPGNAAPTYNGYTVNRNYVITGLDGNGFFTLQLHDLGFLDQSSCNYRFAITWQDGITSFIAPGITGITGAGPVDLSTAISAFSVLLPASAGSSLGGTIAANQVGFGTGPKIIGGSANFLWNSPIAGALNLNTPASSCPTFAACDVLAMTNSGGGTTTAVIVKNSDNSLYLSNDTAGVPSHGYIGWTSNGTAQFLAGGGGAQVQFPTVVTGVFPSGSAVFQLPDGGIGTAVFSLNQAGNMSEAAYTWDTGTGCSIWYPVNSSSIKSSLCPPSSGVTTVMTAVQCGTIAANGACSNTATTNAHCISGIATLGSGTSTITGISPPFTSSSSWFIITNDITTISNPSKGVPASGTTATFTGTGTDNIQFIGCGG
jgi:hypothetical protein